MALADWTPLLATAFAAVAAGTSAYNTAAGRRAAQERLRPFLTAQALTNHDELHFDVYNVGEGVALTSGYVILRGDRKAIGYLGHGTLRPGEHARVRTLLPSDKAEGDFYAVFIARDVTGALWAWSTHDVKRRQLRGTEVDLQEAWAAVYPNVSLPQGDATTLPSDSLTPRQIADGDPDRRLWDDVFKNVTQQPQRP